MKERKSSIYPRAGKALVFLVLFVGFFAAFSGEAKAIRP